MNSAVHPVIQAQSLAKRFGSKDILRDVNLTIPRGAIVGLLGIAINRQRSCLHRRRGR